MKIDGRIAVVCLCVYFSVILEQLDYWFHKQTIDLFSKLSFIMFKKKMAVACVVIIGLLLKDAGHACSLPSRE